MYSFVQPVYQTRDYYEFPTAAGISRELMQDLQEFEKYSKFNIDNLIASKVRETIT